MQKNEYLHEWEKATIKAVSRTLLCRSVYVRAIPYGETVLFVLQSRSRPVYKLHASPVQSMIWNELHETKRVLEIINNVKSSHCNLKMIDIVWVIADLRRRKIIHSAEEKE